MFNKNLIKIDLSKNTKFIYYLSNISKLFIPQLLYKKRFCKMIENSIVNIAYISSRVNYYNKIEDDFSLPPSAVSLKKFKKEKKKTYFFDLIDSFKHFNSHLKTSYLFGDITQVPDYPTLLKSRPISDKNTNSILMKLNKVRHFIFVNDKIKFEDKKDMLAWRGKCYLAHRQSFIQKFHNHPLCNVAQTNTKGDLSVPWQKKKMSINEQLSYKFILCIEGNDVASNLKWVMSSSSIAFMVQPKYETWFMEGRLIPNYHYVLLKDDYSDLQEKIQYYSSNTKEALKIVTNANTYVNQFKNQKREKLISLLVLKKYFEKSRQV